MDNQTQGIFIPYTYTYDQFTVFFYGDRVFLGEKSLPIGQCSVDILNLDEDVLMKIYQRVQDFLPAAQRLLTEKNRQRYSFRSGETKRCLGCRIYFAWVSGFAN